MAITVLKLDGTTEEIEATPGTSCKAAMIDKGLIAAPEDTFRVLCRNRVVDDEPLSEFDGQKLVISPAKKSGGSG